MRPKDKVEADLKKQQFHTDLEYIGTWDDIRNEVLRKDVQDFTYYE